MPACSRLGRKPCLILSSGLYVAGAGLQLVSNLGVGGFEAGRLLNGLGVGAGTLVSPM
jgi:MFS family permease